MSKQKVSQFFQFHQQAGNGAVIGLVVLAILALVGVAYFAGALPGTKKAGDKPAIENVAETMKGPTSDQVTEQTTTRTTEVTTTTQEPPAIKPGNPVVARVEGQDITRNDVLGFIQTLPPQTRQLPLDQLFPLAVNQVVNAKIIAEKTKNVELDEDPEVKRQMALAKEQITRSVYLQKLVEAKVSEDRLKQDYETYLKNFPKIEEVKAAHILVKDEAKARDLLKQINDGADFATLAKTHSVDATASNGGELGYFAQTDVVPEFGKAAFNTAPGTYTKEPVKTDFGYHIIKVEDKRQRPPASYETAKPFLEAQARRDVLENILEDWRKEGKVERFDINGDPLKVEPAAGQ